MNLYRDGRMTTHDLTDPDFKDIALQHNDTVEIAKQVEEDGAEE